MSTLTVAKHQIRLYPIWVERTIQSILFVIMSTVMGVFIWKVLPAPDPAHELFKYIGLIGVGLMLSGLIGFTASYIAAKFLLCRKWILPAMAGVSAIALALALPLLIFWTEHHTGFLFQSLLVVLVGLFICAGFFLFMPYAGSWPIGFICIVLLLCGTFTVYSMFQVFSHGFESVRYLPSMCLWWQFSLIASGLSMLLLILSSMKISIARMGVL